MTFFRDVSPGGAVRGFFEQWHGNPYRWRVLAVSIALTAIVFYLFIPPNVRADPRPFDIVYISTFEEGRSDEEIIASNIANQKVQDEYRALEKERVKIRQDAAAAIGRATGLDIEGMKAEIAKEEAAAERKLERRRAEIMARTGIPAEARTEAVDP
jgi:hypothetical protein